MEIPYIMISDSIKESVEYNEYKRKKDQSEEDNVEEEQEEQHVSPIERGRGKGYMCLGNQEVNVSNKPKKVVIVPRKQRTITIVDNLVEQETVESRLEHVRKEMQKGRGEGSCAIRDDNYEYEDFSKSDYDATRNSSWSNTDKDCDKDDTEDSDMDISDDDSDKRDDANDAASFGLFMYNKS
ncbi:hypothetical protein Tco_1485080 [Tanacetum coccineum]